jgi:hypothetical protein
VATEDTEVIYNPDTYVRSMPHEAPSRPPLCAKRRAGVALGG